MSDLTSMEKLKLEKLLDMRSGYVLDFSNRTFQEFILDNSGLDIYDTKYEHASGSKANRLRAFWRKESNYVVGAASTLAVFLTETHKVRKSNVKLTNSQRGTV